MQYQGVTLTGITVVAGAIPRDAVESGHVKVEMTFVAKTGDFMGYYALSCNCVFYYGGTATYTAAVVEILVTE